MQVYKVFNQNNVQTKVTDADLDQAVPRVAPLATHLANAAGVARRHDLVPHLRETLCVGERRSKLAAARALLALVDRDAVDILVNQARTEADSVVANIFRATALRLQGVEALRAAFESDEAPDDLKRLGLSIYPGTFDLMPEDCAFLGDVLAAYLDEAKPWVRAMDRSTWRDGVYVLVSTLTRRAPELPGELRSRIADVVSRVATSKADADAKRDAKKWLKNIE